MLNGQISESVLKDLNKTKYILEQEKKEYVQRNNAIESEIKNILNSNEKLLDCLRDRHKCYLELLNSDSETDEELSKMLEQEQKLLVSKKKIEYLGEENVIDNTINTAHFQLRNLKKEYKNSQASKDNNILNVMKLSEEKDKLEQENQKLQEILDSITINLDPSLQNENRKVINRVSQCQQLRRDIQNANLIKERSLTSQLSHDSSLLGNSISAKSALNLLEIELSSDTPLSLSSSEALIDSEKISKDMSSNHSDNENNLEIHNSAEKLSDTLPIIEDQVTYTDEATKTCETNLITEREGSNLCQSESSSMNSKNRVKSMKKDFQNSKEKKEYSMNNSQKELVPENIIAIQHLSESKKTQKNDQNKVPTKKTSKKQKSQKTVDTIDEKFSNENQTEKQEAINSDKIPIGLHKHHDKLIKGPSQNVENYNNSKENTCHKDYSENKKSIGTNFHGNIDDNNDNESFQSSNDQQSSQANDYVIDRCIQTKDNFIYHIAYEFRQLLKRLKKENKITGLIEETQNKIYEIESDWTELQNKQIDTNVNKKFTTKRLKIDLGDSLTYSIFGTTTFSSKKVNTSAIPSLDDLKSKIFGKSDQTTKILSLEQQKMELESDLEKKRIKLHLLEMKNERKEASLKTLLDRLKVIDPYIYSLELRQTFESSISIGNGDEGNESNSISIENQIEDVEDEIRNKEAQIEDLLYVNSQLQQKLHKMSREPRSNVKALCETLKNQRYLITENIRQMSFLHLEIEHVSNKINTIAKLCSKPKQTDLMTKIDQQRELIKKLKLSFNYSRGIGSEKRGMPLTSEHELIMMEAQIREISAQIDISKMKRNGIISKIDKLLRIMSEQKIIIPELPSSLQF